MARYRWGFPKNECRILLNDGQRRRPTNPIDYYGVHWVSVIVSIMLTEKIAQHAQCGLSLIITYDRNCVFLLLQRCLKTMRKFGKTSLPFSYLSFLCVVEPLD